MVTSNYQEKSFSNFCKGSFTAYECNVCLNLLLRQIYLMVKILISLSLTGVVH